MVVKSDLYTKIILTIIAVCLLINVLKDSSIPATASTRTEIIDVNIRAVNGQYIYNSIPVRVQ